MQAPNVTILAALTLVSALAATTPTDATTLRRVGLEALADGHSTIVVGRVLDAQPHWNDDGSFIVTDVDLEATDAIKGASEGATLRITLLGGTVDELSALVLGGAELFPDRTYLLFLDREQLGGAGEVLTVREHSQGVFEIVEAEGAAARAISQAAFEPLVPDADGETQAPGGAAGLDLERLVRQLRERVEAQAEGTR